VVLLRRGANVQTVAGMLGCHRNTIYRLAKDGKKLRQKCPNTGEEQEMNAATLQQLRSDIKADLEEKLEREREEIFRMFYALRHGETPVESWKRVLREETIDEEAA
jgi:transposase